MDRPPRDEYYERRGLGPALTRYVASDGLSAGLHRADSGLGVWLVIRKDDGEGADLTASQSTDGVAVTIYGDVLLAGGVSDHTIAEVELKLHDRRDARAVCRPSASGAWIAGFEHVRLPTILSLVERDQEGRATRERQLDFPDGPAARGSLLARAMRAIRTTLDLPGRLGLSRGSLSYPATSRAHRLSRRR